MMATEPLREQAPPHRPEPKTSDRLPWTNWWTSPGRFFLLAAVSVLVFFPKLLLGLTTFFYRDYGVLGYPFVFYAHDAFWRGEYPLWNPLSNCGAPFLAQWGTMTTYPFSLIYLLLPLPWSLTLFCFLHILLGALGFRAVAWRWTGDAMAASIAGMVFLFNGLIFSSLTWPNYLVALGWMPWVLWHTERAWQGSGTRAIALAGLAAALQLLAGVPEIVLMTWLVVGCLWARDFIKTRARRARMTLLISSVVLIAAGLTLAQLLPFFDLLASSQRDRFFATNKWSMPGWGWANLLVPLFHAFQTPQGTFFQFGQEFLGSYYWGGWVLVLSIWTAWRVRHSTVWILGGLVLLSLIMALGDHGHLYPWVREKAPFLGVGRYAIKFMLLTVVTMPLLVAFGIAQGRRTAVEARSRRQARLGILLLTGLLLAAVGAILIVARIHPFPYDQWDVTLRNSLWRAAFLVGTVVLLFKVCWGPERGPVWLWPTLLLAAHALDISTHWPNQLPTLPADVMTPGIWQQNQSVPPPVPGQGRLLITPKAEEHLLRSRVEDHSQDFLGKRLAEWSNLNLLDGLPKVNGSSTLQIREQKEIQDLVYLGTNALPSGLLDFLAATHITSPNSAVDWTLRRSALPWATGGQRPICADSATTLQRLVADDFDPRATVYLPVDVQAETSDVTAGACRVELQAFTSHRIALSVEAEAPRLVVVAQSYYPAWKASVNGTPVPLWRANHGFQALRVPAGRHEVVLRYQDNSFRFGLAISLLSLGCAALLWWRGGPSRPSI